MFRVLLQKTPQSASPQNRRDPDPVFFRIEPGIVVNKVVSRIRDQPRHRQKRQDRDQLEGLLVLFRQNVFRLLNRFCGKNSRTSLPIHNPQNTAGKCLPEEQTHRQPGD